MDTLEKQQMTGTWKQMTGRVKEAWGILTDDDLDRYEGKRDQLEGYIEKRTGEARDAIRTRIDEIAKKLQYRF